MPASNVSGSVTAISPARMSSLMHDRYRAAGLLCSMILSDLPTPAEALAHTNRNMPGLRAGGKPVPTFRDHALNSAQQLQFSSFMSSGACGGVLIAIALIAVLLSGLVPPCAVPFGMMTR